MGINTLYSTHLAFIPFPSLRVCVCVCVCVCVWRGTLWVAQIRSINLQQGIFSEGSCTLGAVYLILLHINCQCVGECQESDYEGQPIINVTPSVNAGSCPPPLCALNSFHAQWAPILSPNGGMHSCHQSCHALCLNVLWRTSLETMATSMHCTLHDIGRVIIIKGKSPNHNAPTRCPRTLWYLTLWLTHLAILYLDIHIWMFLYSCT